MNNADNCYGEALAGPLLLRFLLRAFFHFFQDAFCISPISGLGRPASLRGVTSGTWLLGLMCELLKSK
jgi:hypothetical protein